MNNLLKNVRIHLNNSNSSILLLRKRESFTFFHFRSFQLFIYFWKLVIYSNWKRWSVSKQNLNKYERIALIYQLYNTNIYLYFFIYRFFFVEWFNLHSQREFMYECLSISSFFFFLLVLLQLTIVTTTRLTHPYKIEEKVFFFYNYSHGCKF
jgi:hypothetical protein